MYTLHLVTMKLFVKDLKGEDNQIWYSSFDSVSNWELSLQ